MILWTIQSPEAVSALKRTGRLVANAGVPEPQYRSPFAWMARQMVARIGPSPRRGRPIWAWHTWSATHSRPDLRASGHVESGQRAARIEFVATEPTVLLSDFELWHYVLNGWHLPMSALTPRSVSRARVGAASNVPADRAAHSSSLSRLERSWERIFVTAHSLAPRGVAQHRRSIQATLWVIPLNTVTHIQWFRAR